MQDENKKQLICHNLLLFLHFIYPLIANFHLCMVALTLCLSSGRYKRLYIYMLTVNYMLNKISQQSNPHNIIRAYASQWNNMTFCFESTRIFSSFRCDTASLLTPFDKPNLPSSSVQLRPDLSKGLQINIHWMRQFCSRGTHKLETIRTSDH